ncbi:unnamed protein product [Musa textilis]
MLRCRCRPPPWVVLRAVRWLSRIAPPSPATAEPVIRVSNNVARLGEPKEGPKPRQLLSLPPFPSTGTDPLPGRKKDPAAGGHPRQVTAISWVKHYFADIPPEVIQSHFNKGLVHVESSNHDFQTKENYLIHCLKKDSAIIVLNKPPKVPVKGNLPVHNSMDILAAAALSYGSDQGPKLVHRLDRESSGLLLMGRTKESFTRLHWLFTNVNLAKSSSEIWNNACEATTRRYWALVIGSPKEREGIISAPLTKVLLNNGKAERVILAHPSGIDGSQDAITEYRVMGPTINGCSWVELCPLTGRKHQLRVHCAEALGTPIVGDYKYGWFVHQRWKQMPRVDYETLSGKPYKLRRPEGLEVQKGSVLSKVPLLHLHCREMVIPNISKFLGSSGEWLHECNPWSTSKPDLLRIVAPMPSHMKISWNVMSSFLV